MRSVGASPCRSFLACRASRSPSCTIWTILRYSWIFEAGFTIPAMIGIAIGRSGGKETIAWRRGRLPHHWKNLMVISGGTISIARCISSAAFANRLVSMLIPTPQPPQRM